MGNAGPVIHLVAERVDIWVCAMAAYGQRGTDRRDLATCPHCLAGQYNDGTPVANLREVLGG